MSVRAKRIVRGVGRLENAVSAASVRKPEHPLYHAYRNWLGEQTDTKRQARKFLQAYPFYKHAQLV